MFMIVSCISGPALNKETIVKWFNFYGTVLYCTVLHDQMSPSLITSSSTACFASAYEESFSSKNYYAVPKSNFSNW